MAYSRNHLFRLLLKLKLKSKILLYNTIIRLPLKVDSMESKSEILLNSQTLVLFSHFKTSLFVLLVPFRMQRTKCYMMIYKLKSVNELTKLHFKAFKRLHSKLTSNTNPLTMSSNFIPNEPSRKLKINWNQNLLL